jgi:hypothetical protein
MAQTPKKNQPQPEQSASRPAKEKGTENTSGRPDESTATPEQRKRAAVDESGAKLD